MVTSSNVSVKPRAGAARRPLAVTLVSSAMLLVGLAQASAQADVTSVTGSAFGYHCAVTAVGNTCSPGTPTPTVSLASNASNSPQNANATSGRADAGPATMFDSGPIAISTQGSLGAGGSVTSSTDIQNINASGNESFTATRLTSTCTASETGVSGSTTITGGTLETDSGDSDPTNSIPDHPPVSVDLPTNPDPNTTYSGHIHVGNTTDNFRYVFNEQVVNADGSLTVNAAHEYLLGPNATGDLIVGQVVCGVKAAPPPPKADLSVDLSDSPDPVAARGQVTYTVNVANAGPDAATAVKVSTKLSGAKFVSASGATCTVGKGKASGISCDVGSLASGAGTQFTMVVQAGRKPITATSTVSSGVTDPNTANNSDTETTGIGP